jgi:hypothetical protein
MQRRRPPESSTCQISPSLRSVANSETRQTAQTGHAGASAPANAAGRLTRIRVTCWVVALGFALVHAWMYRFDIRDVDGVSYLDMGDAYFRGDWGTALNGYWSPLYSWLLGLALWLLRPTPVWEYPTTQLVNVIIFVGALACFDYFLGELIRSDQARAADSSDAQRGLPPWAVLAIGYPLFVWSALYWQRFWLQTPDHVVAAVIFVAAGLLLRILRGRATWRVFAAFGAVLGIGYLTKAAMLPVAFVFLVVGTAAGDARRAMPRALAAPAVFLVIAAPLVVALSTVKGRFTFGDSGRLNYAWFVNHLRAAPDWKYMPHWRGGSDFGNPIHPARQISDSPVAFEFATPVGGSYPLWYDPSYWHEGLHPRLEARTQLERLRLSARYYADLFADGPQPALFVAAAVLYAAGWRRRHVARQLLRHWILFVPAAAALGMYSLVWVEGRYIGAYLVTAWMGILAGARLPAGPSRERLVAGVALGVASLTLGLAGLRTVLDLTERDDSDNDGRVHARIAAALARNGVQPGDHVAVVGSWLNAARWARLARAKVVAEVPLAEADAFWEADSATQARVVGALCATGAEMIVAGELPRERPIPGWTRIKGARHFAFLTCGAKAPAP